jgi:hypothetical protein
VPKTFPLPLLTAIDPAPSMEEVERSAMAQAAAVRAKEAADRLSRIPLPVVITLPVIQAEERSVSVVRIPVRLEEVHVQRAEPRQGVRISPPKFEF